MKSQMMKAPLQGIFLQKAMTETSIDVEDLERTFLHCMLHDEETVNGRKVKRGIQHVIQEGIVTRGFGFSTQRLKGVENLKTIAEAVQEYIEAGKPRSLESFVLKHAELYIKFMLKGQRKKLSDPDYEDLYQETLMYFLRGVRKLDCAGSATTYLAYWINSAIRKFKRQNYVVPFFKSQTAFKFFYYAQRERKRLGMSLSSYLKEVSFSAKNPTIRNIARFFFYSYWTPIPLHFFEKPELESWVSSGEESLQEKLFLQKETIQKVRKALEKYEWKNEREREIFSSRFLEEEPPTLESLGDRFFITRERVRQIEFKASMHVFHYLGTLFPEDRLC